MKMKYFSISLDLPWHLPSELCSFHFIDPIHIQLDWDLTISSFGVPLWVIFNFFFLNSTCSFLVYRTATDFYINLVFCDFVVLACWFQEYFIDSLRFSTYTIMSSMNIVFILSQFVHILFFSSLITLARTYSMIIDRICERGQPCFVSDFRGESIQFYNIHACVRSHFSHVWLFVTLWMVALQTPLSMGFSRQAYWSGLLCPPLGDLPDRDQTLSPALAGGFFTWESFTTTWEAPLHHYV